MLVAVAVDNILLFLNSALFFLSVNAGIFGSFPSFFTMPMSQRQSNGRRNLFLSHQQLDSWKADVIDKEEKHVDMSWLARDKQTYYG